MADSLPGDVEQSIAVSNVKSIAEQPAMLANMAYANLVNNVNLSQQNAIANQQAMNQLNITIVGKIVNSLIDLGPKEATATTHLTTGDDMAKQIAELQAIVKALQSQGR